jgi:hypothetical protein
LQENDSQSSLTLSQQAYVLTTSLRHIVYGLTIFLIITIGYLILGTLVKEPVIALVSVVIIISPFLVFVLIKSRRFYTELRTWNEQYIDTSYTVIFSTTIPKGNTNGEKVIYLASFIFPQLRADYIDYYYVFNFAKRFWNRRFKRSWKEIINSSLNVKVEKGYNIDIALETLEGFFIVKDFGDGIVTIQDLKQLIMIISGRFRKNYQKINIFRLIVVAKEYDQLFLNRDSLEKIIDTELKAKFKIDLIVQEEIGYSVLWVG